MELSMFANYLHYFMIFDLVGGGNLSTNVNIFECHSLTLRGKNTNSEIFSHKLMKIRQDFGL